MTAKEQIIPALLQSLQNMNTTHEQRIYDIKMLGSKAPV